MAIGGSDETADVEVNYGTEGTRHAPRIGGNAAPLDTELACWDDQEQETKPGARETQGSQSESLQ